MSQLMSRIVRSIPSQRLDRKPTLVATYAYFTVVRAQRVGMSMTLNDDMIFAGGLHSTVRHLGRVESRPLSELITWTESAQPIERSIGMAAVNACLPLEGLNFHEGNALAVTERLGAGKNVVVVGHFPHLENIRSVAKNFQVLEKRPLPGDLPAEEAPRVVPTADVLTMTGVTCLNDTVEELLALKKPGAICILLGPTVPMNPALFEAGVDIIAGAWIQDEQQALPMMAQGAVARVLKGLRHVLATRDPSLLAGYPVVTPPPDLEE